MSLPLVLATRNRHKVAELRRILREAGLDTGDGGDTGDTGSDDTLGLATATGAAPGVRLLALDSFPQVPEVAETGTTFAENALLKATAVAETTGLPAIADDSGLCVDVLGGSPGVFSARWAGRARDDEANLLLLLEQLADVPDEHLGAHFTCAAALATPDGRQHVVEGRLHGRLTRAPRGTHGFGYDPIFVPDGADPRTTAELSPGEKDAISHRGRAFRALVPYLRSLLREPAVGARPGS